LGLYKSFKQTVFTDLANGFAEIQLLLVPLYTDLLKEEYGKLSVIFAFMIFFNVILAYGMETAFLFYSKESNKESVVETSMVSSLDHYAFLFIALYHVIYLNGRSRCPIHHIRFGFWH
jgi:hypothetical protein